MAKLMRNWLVSTLVVATILLLGLSHYAETQITSARGIYATAANSWSADQTYNDNVNITLGTGGDADLDYNGTNVVLDPKVVGTGGFIVSGILATTQATIDVDGATALPITSSSVNLTCTGAETITTITGGLSGQLLAIQHEDTDCILNDTDVDTADQLDLVGANGDLTGAADLMILLYFNGTYWQELIRSQN